MPETSEQPVLAGLKALVTGGGRGIGRRTATALAFAGAQVAICSRTEDELRATAAGIKDLVGRGVLAAVVDVADRDSVLRLAERLSDEWGRVDIVVNNAATLGPVGLLCDVEMGQWLTALMANVGSVAIVSQLFIPLMQGGGSIINLSGGGIGGPSMQERVSAYTTSKAAVVALTEALAAELETQGIRVNAIAPGPASTRFTESILAAGLDKAGARTYASALAQLDAPDQLEAYLRLVTWLASDESSWLTGRLLSARWDTVEHLEKLRPDRLAPSLLKLRRIDGELFTSAATVPTNHGDESSRSA